MKYNQPFGNEDANAAYVNGNPALGVQGSIPPASAIEYPQREILAVIEAAGIVPSNSNLHQLLDALQWLIDQSPTAQGRVHYGAAGGTADTITTVTEPEMTTIAPGHILLLRIVSNNTTAVTLTVDGFGPYPVTRPDGSDLPANALIASQVAVLVTGVSALGASRFELVASMALPVSGEGVEVDGTSHVNLDFPTLDAATPVSADLFAFHQATGDVHKKITFANLLAAMGGVGAGGIKSIQTFTANGAYTRTSGATQALVFATGGGGAGGMHICCAGGGGAGSTAIALVDVSSLPTVAVTIGSGGLGAAPPFGGSVAGGSGGSPSFGTHAVAGGGAGNLGWDKGGLGGVATAGSMLIAGGDGCTSYTGGEWGSGTGGSSFWGGGGAGASRADNNGNGISARCYGAAGGGGDSGMGAGAKGGDGMPGVILVVEF